MLRKLILALAALVLAGVALIAVGLVSAHLAIRRERAPLPKAQAILDSRESGDNPRRLSFINTASQAMPRSGVLDTEKDPRPNDPYVMSHPSFVLEWADGRILLIDTGMNRAQAVSFGWPLETFAGAAPLQPNLSVAEQLGEQRRRVQGIVFTHLHTDHTGGILDLCVGLDHDVPVFMTEAQRERPNHTTKPGLEILNESGCARQETLARAALMPVPGFPGVYVVAAGGHTPGSQLIVAHVTTEGGARTYAFVGDIVNHIDGVLSDVPKPYLYQLLIVPEDEQRQAELRHFLRDLQGHGISLVVSHDQRAIEALPIPTWEP